MQKEFTVNGVQYLAVEVPRDATQWKIIGGFLQMWPYRDGIRQKMLPEGSWEIVGKARELFNDNCKKIFPDYTIWYSTEVPASVEGNIPVDHVETSLMKFDKLRTEHNLNDNDLIIKRL